MSKPRDFKYWITGESGRIGSVLLHNAASFSIWSFFRGMVALVGVLGGIGKGLYPCLKRLKPALRPSENHTRKKVHYQPKPSPAPLF